jgi:hypothetical protein
VKKDNIKLTLNKLKKVNRGNRGDRKKPHVYKNILS